jgi:hypothetical protein
VRPAFTGGRVTLANDVSRKTPVKDSGRTCVPAHRYTAELIPEIYRIPGKAKYIQVYESAGMNVKFANSPSPYIYLYIYYFFYFLFIMHEKRNKE